MHHPTDRIIHTTAFVKPVVEHWLEREIAQWVHPMKDRSDDPSHHERTLLPRSYISLLAGMNNSSMGPSWRINPTTHRTMSERSYHGATSHSWLEWATAQWVHHEGSIRTTHRTMSERSYHGATSHSWLEWATAQWVHHEGSIRRPIAPWANALTTELHLAPMTCMPRYKTTDLPWTCHLGREDTDWARRTQGDLDWCLGAGVQICLKNNTTEINIYAQFKNIYIFKKNNTHTRMHAYKCKIIFNEHISVNIMYKVTQEHMNKLNTSMHQKETKTSGCIEDFTPSCTHTHTHK